MKGAQDASLFFVPNFFLYFNIKIREMRIFGMLMTILLIISSCLKDKVPTPFQNVPNNPDSTITDTLGKIEVHLTGMQNTNGKINFGLYNSNASFNNPSMVYKSLVLNPLLDEMTFTLDSIPAGTYAFGVFHDENNNEQIDQNWIGIPTEGFAFSNNAMGAFGPPSFEQAKFVVLKQETHVQTIALHFF